MMQLKLHRNIKSDTASGLSYILDLSVSEVVGNITPCIFVHEYVPYNPATGASSLNFTNVAYLDELTEVKDYVQTKNKMCLVRKSCLTKRFDSIQSLNDFCDIVFKDVRRLLQQHATLTDLDCADISITEHEIISTPTELCGNTENAEQGYTEDTDELSEQQEVVSISFDGRVH